ncbi:MAG: methylmalonyl-CoA epimerase [Ignavibacteria bacterium]|nr:methylmalonyl-CoA epimerase [Ignavibacteria bacterium]
MIKRISHIGIAVRDLNKASEVFGKLLNSTPSNVEYVAEQKVNVVKFKVGESTIELLQGTDTDSPITKYLEKRGEGIHHVAFETDDIHKEIIRLDSEGLELINKEPKVGSDSMLIAFLHPKSLCGVLTEVCKHR